MSNRLYTEEEKCGKIEKHHLSLESNTAWFEKGRIFTVATWRVFRMKPQEVNKSGEIVQIKFFVGQNGMVEQVYLIEENGRKVVWDAGENYDFPDISDERLCKTFQQLAFGNPEDFRKLYQVLRVSGQERLWQCIQKQKTQIQQMFNFS